MNRLATGRVSGFTLVELMIVVAIIGLLTAVMIPTYRDFVIRAKVLDGIQMYAPVKAEIVEFYSINGRFPRPDRDQLIGYDAAPVVGNPVSWGYVENFEWFSGMFDGVDKIWVRLQFNKSIGIDPNSDDSSTRSVHLVGLARGGDMVEFLCGTWATGAYDIDTKYLPSDCREIDLMTNTP